MGHAIVPKVFSSNGVDIGRRLVSAAWGRRTELIDGLRCGTERSPQGQARDVAGHLRETPEMEKIVTTATHTGSLSGYERSAGSWHLEAFKSGAIASHLTTIGAVPQSSFQAVTTTHSQCN